MTAPDGSGVHRGEFALSLNVTLRAGTWRAICPTCERKSARPFLCVVCNRRSITLGVAVLRGEGAVAS